ncbi:MAG: hypothetical protein M1834_005228 [Cirrosporium novae-zelandiae]|nr:MAG: hypothetical protein M1834_005228 [Cirrosporium novae-zelandiae]
MSSFTILDPAYNVLSVQHVEPNFDTSSLSRVIALGSLLMLITVHTTRELIKAPVRGSRAISFTIRHRLWGYISLVSTIGCAVTTFRLCWLCKFEIWEEIVHSVVWFFICLGRVIYLIPSRHRQLFYQSTNLVSLALFVTATLPRDLCPLVLLNGQGFVSIPVLAWLQILLAFLSAIFIPLFTPLHYELLDQVPHPSETCSPIERWWFYSWMNQLISAGYHRSGDLTPDDLYPLKVESLPIHWLQKFVHARGVVGSTGGALWKIFRGRLIIMASLMILCGITEFLGTFGLRQLLRYLQGSPDVTFQPWFSIFLFGICPVIRGLCMQIFEWFSTHAIGNLKAMIVSTVYQQLLKQPAKQPSGARLNVGQVHNHISIDVDKLATLRYTFMAGFLVPAELLVASIILYQSIGWSYLPTLALLLVTRVPLAQLMNSALSAAQSRVLQASDGRLARINESIRCMATITILGQAHPFITKILEKRSRELDAIWRKVVILTSTESVSNALVFISFALSLALYTLVAKKPLEASVAFTMVAVFNIVKSMLTLAVVGVGQYAQAMTSLKRIATYLEDGAKATNDTFFLLEDESTQELRFENATFGIDVFRKGLCPLLKNLNVEFVRGGLNVIKGPIGSGKTMLLQALLFEDQQLGGICKLRDSPLEPISYASQMPWLQSGSVRGNIIFNTPFLPTRYKAVLNACGLDFDLTTMKEHDLTEVGEGGSALSGGQRQRVALARAVYAPTKTVLLDDVLSSLDGFTARWVVENCILGSLMEGRTLIIVTDNSKCHKEADLIVCMDGGTVKEIIAKNSARGDSEGSSKDMVDVVADLGINLDDQSSLSSTIDTPPISEAYEDNQDQSTISPTPMSVGQTESRRKGLIGRLYMFKYIRHFGSWPFIVLLFLAVISTQGLDIILPFWLSLWSRAYDGIAVVNNIFYLGAYTGLGMLQVTCGAASLLVLYGGAWRAGKTEHQKLLYKVFGATYEWLINTPAGQIINRFSSDMMSLDDTLISSLRPVLETYLSIGFRIITVSSLIPIFLLPSVLFVSLGLYTGQRYLYASTAVKRLYAVSLSPLFHSVTETASGISTIRAFRAEKHFKSRFLAYTEQHIRAWEAVSDSQRWLAIRMDIFASLISFSAAIFAFLQHRSDPSIVGFSLTTSTSLCSALLYLVYLSSILEVEMNSFQRIEDYIHQVPQEKKLPDSTDQASEVGWPSQGSILVRGLTAGYSLDGREVLQDINLDATPGERIAVVGRTGSGKSSFACSLFRLTNKFAGSIRIDGIDIDLVDVDHLRQSISLIPQNPTLFDGTLRFNLDLSGDLSDEHLQAILNDVMGHETCSLDDPVLSNGQNFSQGERQLIALARAIAKKSKIVVIDEATANMDHASEIRIQTLLRDKFQGSTLIAIAHRIDSVLDFDQVLVLEKGKVIERGHPRSLVESGEGTFYAINPFDIIVFRAQAICGVKTQSVNNLNGTCDLTNVDMVSDGSSKVEMSSWTVGLLAEMVDGQNMQAA